MSNLAKIEMDRDVRYIISMRLIGVMTKRLIVDLNNGLSSIINDPDLEKLLGALVQQFPIDSIAFVCIVPFVRKAVQPKLDVMSLDDLMALDKQWLQKVEG